MNRSVVAALLIVTFNCAAERVVNYSEKNLVLTGMVVFPSGNDAVFGESAFPALVLDEILTAHVLPADQLSTEETTNLVQLAAVSNTDFEELERLEGKRASIVCSDIFSAATAHHFTPILCTVGSIRQINTPRPKKTTK